MPEDYDDDQGVELTSDNPAYAAALKGLPPVPPQIGALDKLASRVNEWSDWLPRTASGLPCNCVYCQRYRAGLDINTGEPRP